MEYNNLNKNILETSPIPYLILKLHETLSDENPFTIEGMSEKLTYLKNNDYEIKINSIEEILGVDNNSILKSYIKSEREFSLYISSLKGTYKICPKKLNNNEYILWMVDISKEVESEEIHEMKTEFFANLSHELRTPVNIIFSTLQVLNLKIESIKETSQHDSMLKYTNIAIQNTYRLLKLVNNLIDSNKITSGYFDFKPQNYDIIFFIESICQSIVEFAKTKNIEVTFDTELEEKSISFDLDKMERIILNILSNAIKFSRDGDEISVYIKEVNEMIEIKISDTGIGIPKDKLECIFDRFKQVDNQHIRKGEGSGIGLYLVKSLVDMHKGSIFVESELDKGSTFTIRIPIQYSEEENGWTIIDKNFQDSHIEKIKVEFSDIYA